MRSSNVDISALAHLIARLNADLEPEAVLQIVCDEVALALDIPVVIAGAYDEQLRVIFYMAATGVAVALAGDLLPTPTAPASPSLEIGPPYAGPAVAHCHELGAGVCGTLGLWYSERPVGALVLVLPAGQPDFAPAEYDLLLAIGDLAAQALVHATRFAAIHTRAAHLEALNTLGRALAETYALDRIFELLYEATLVLLPVVEGAIFSLLDPEQQLITCAFAILDGERLDVSEFPPLQLAPLGHGFQSNAIHLRRPIIVGSQEELFQRVPNVVYIGTPGEEAESILYVPMLSPERVVGVLQVQSFVTGTFSMAHATMLGLAANVAAVAIENARLVADLQRSNQELREAYDSTREGWSRALALRDHEPHGHSARVTALTVRLARAAGIGEQELTYIRWGALLHDIGKMGIPDAVLLKPGTLTEEEGQVMRMHPVYAQDLLAPIVFLRPALAIPYCHHERWDGAGYPRGLRGDEIPLEARMFAVIDIWDALRSDRPYRPAWSVERVREYIHSLTGTHLDPEVVALFFRVLDGDSTDPTPLVQGANGENPQPATAEP